MRKNIGLIVIIVLAVVPIVRWFSIAPLSLRFFNLQAASGSIGQIFGLLGITLFSINLILSSRLKFLDNLFYGLDRLYKIHRWNGTIAFSLLLFHPLFLAVRYAVLSLRDAAFLFIPSSDNMATGGILALSIMIVLLVITFWSRFKYENWKLTHKFMTIAFSFAVLHAASIPSDISRDSVLRIYILSLAAIALSAGVWKAFLSRFINNYSKFTIKTVDVLNENVTDIKAEPKAKRIGFVPGQFSFVRFKSKRVKNEQHPFTISSSPKEKNIGWTIKSLGDFTETLRFLRPGESVLVDAPYGKFSYLNMKHKRQVWMAGGIGITPFLSMARSLEEGYQINLYYCTKTKEEAVVFEELLKISEKTKGFKIIPWFSEEKGQIDAEIVMEASPDLIDGDILLCGPSGFMKSLREQFVKLGVSKNNIHFEEFKFV